MKVEKLLFLFPSAWTFTAKRLERYGQALGKIRPSAWKDTAKRLDKCMKLANNNTVAKSVSKYNIGKKFIFYKNNQKK